MMSIYHGRGRRNQRRVTCQRYYRCDVTPSRRHCCGSKGTIRCMPTSKLTRRNWIVGMRRHTECLPKFLID
ncbi:hypothetical protein FOMG_16926 [Fusarium oxysporum f. sp. melonis 26406]|uniref:Uncharacterized protein n=1 Tax=Fusarium oxysporum f. sp. melonis 26406 TaxID=1089452 RepID=W9ZE48_FUSOX|nr:hypothetical protein FOMG_16926 [Fusarium oxysporum f. sp. melonis 26406]